MQMMSASSEKKTNKKKKKQKSKKKHAVDGKSSNVAVSLTTADTSTRGALGIVIEEDLSNSCPPPWPDAPPGIFAQFLTNQNLAKPSGIQAQLWPAIHLTTADIIGISATGSGKTLAAILPAVPHIQARY